MGISIYSIFIFVIAWKGPPCYVGSNLKIILRGGIALIFKFIKYTTCKVKNASRIRKEFGVFIFYYSVNTSRYVGSRIKCYWGTCDPEVTFNPSIYFHFLPMGDYTLVNVKIHLFLAFMKGTKMYYKWILN